MSSAKDTLIHELERAIKNPSIDDRARDNLKRCLERLLKRLEEK